MRAVRSRMTFANVVSVIALFVALGGSAYAATHLGKNSVGAKQIKNNAITEAEIKNGAVTAAKVKSGSLTGTQINTSTLRSVPTAQSAQTAQTAQTANSLAAPEAWHVVGAPGQPAFENGWADEQQTVGAHGESVAFYKDQEGVVHLRGEAIDPSTQDAAPIFRLPPGFRPASGTSLRMAVACGGEACPYQTSAILIAGPNFEIREDEDEVLPPPEAAYNVWLDGVTFRAGS